MRVREIKSQITLSFSIINNSDEKVNTYNFKIDNLKNNFETPSFLNIRDSISVNKIEMLNIKTIENLSKLIPCELHYMFSDSKKIVLLREDKGFFLKYKLIYWSTQRGWEYVNTD